MLNKKSKEIIISRTSCFQGKRCVGLDSGAIVSIIIYPEAFSEFSKKIEDSLFNFTHDECVGGKNIKIENSEAFKVLTIKKYKLSQKEAKERISGFIKSYNIGVIPKGKKNINLVKYLYREGKNKGIDVHPPDVFIIADFKSCGVNLVYSNNYHFRKLCELIGMSAPYFPTEEKQTVDKPYFDIFGKRKHKKKSK